MGIERVRKVIIFTHKRVAQDLLERLQRGSILHISFAEGTEFIKEKETSKRIERAISYIQGKIKDLPRVTTIEDFEIPRDVSVESIVEEVEEVVSKENEYNRRVAELKKEYNELINWKNLDAKVEELNRLKYFKGVAGTFKDFALYEEFLKENKDDFIVQEVEKGSNYVNVLIFYSPAREEELRKVLVRYGFEEVKFKFKGTVREHILEIEKEIKTLEKELANLQERILKFKDDVPILYLFHDFYKNEEVRRSVLANLSGTERAFVISGWIKEKDRKKFENIVSKINGVDFFYPDEIKETPPVALKNNFIFRPFELITEMYSYPLPDEIDPSALLAPFFAFFFGLCITDAVYGIIISILAIALLLKKKGGKLIGVFLAGGIFTIIAGAMTGGWLGDFFSQFGLKPLFNLRNKLMLFDPMKEPMKFFILSIALGFFQYIFGIFVEIYDSLKHGNLIDAFFEHLAWVVFLISLVSFGLGITGTIPRSVNNIFIPLILISSAFIIFFSIKDTIPSVLLSVPWFLFILSFLFFMFYKIPYIDYALKITFLLTIIVSLIKFLIDKKFIFAIIMFLITGLSALWFLNIIPASITIIAGMVAFLITKSTRTLTTRFLIGIYNIYNGSVGTLSAVLSYVRLMALGMVTGGIGMAINAIVKMMFNNPIGIFFGIIVLIFGHIYNMAINMLGGFVHTLRLQYVEFFPRFFTGGGEPFRPFKFENDFVKIKKEV